MGYQDTQKRTVRLRVNTATGKYKKYVSAHIIAQAAPICPSTLQLDIAIDALMSLVTGSEIPILQPQLRGMDSHAPICMEASKDFWLEAKTSDADCLIWDWKMTRNSAEGGSSSATLHVSGTVVVRSRNDPEYHNEFARYERLVGRRRLLLLLDGDEADAVIQGGRNIYKAFSQIV